MSEKAPVLAPSAQEKKEAEIARLRARLEYEEKIHEGSKAFGVYDEDVTPAEGEFTYEQYLEQRPSDGIVRSFDGPRDAKSGQFASQEAYEAQKGSSQDHYDKVGSLVNTGEYQLPNYENMGVVQLAKEAAKARALGDRAGEEEVRAAVDHHLTMDAMKDDSETPEEAQARYEAEMARYDSLVERFENLASAASSGRSASPESTPGEAATTDESAAEEVTEAKAEAEAQPEPATETLTDDVDEKETATASNEVHYKGEKVEIKEVFTSPSGRKVAEVVEGNGESRFVPEDELEVVVAQDAAAEAATPAADEEAPEPVTEVLDGSETEAASESANEETSTEPVVEEVEQPDRRERVKNWFKKHGRTLQTVGGATFWKTKWGRQKTNPDATLNDGVTEEMSEEKKENKRRNNRRGIIAGVTALALVAGGTGIGLGVAELLDNDHPKAPQEQEVTAPTDEATDLETPAPEETTPVEQLPFETGDMTGPANIPQMEAPAVSEVYNIPSGGGGEALFVDLGIDPAKWYANENTLLSQFPDDFYRMNDGHVGIARPGMLSQGAQTFIESLR